MSLVKQVRPERVLVVATPLVAAAVAVLVLAWGHVLPSSAQADDTGPRMALMVWGAGVSCDAASEPTECIVPLGGEFVLGVQVIEAPEEGYVGIQTEVYYGSLAYESTAAADDEIVWPDGGALSVRDSEETIVRHGDATSIIPPFPVSNHTNTIVELAFACSAEAETLTLALLPFGPDGRELGAGFKLPGPGGGIGDAVPAKTVGTEALDLDGDTTAESVDVADTLDVNCSAAAQVPTATSEEAAAGTPTAEDGAAGLPVTGNAGGIDAGGRIGAGLWAVIAALLAAAAAGLAIFAWRYVRVR